MGVKLVNSKEELIKILERLKTEFRFDYWLIQEYLTHALEVSCGCLQRLTGEFLELPPIEIIPQVSSFFDYSAKYQVGGSKEITPPQTLTKELAERISKAACQIHQLLRCRAYSRSDFLVRDGEIFYLETNTLPGMTQTSLLPQEARAAGMSFSELIDFVIEN